MQQQVLAAAVGLAPGVMGRVELGTRACRASELRIIAKELGTTTDELLRDVTPLSTAELVERAETRRDIAYKGLREYAEAVADAMRAVADESVQLGDDELSSPADVREHLSRTQPDYLGVTAEKALVPEIAAALDALRASLPVKAPRKTPLIDTAGKTFAELQEELNHDE